MAKDKKEEPDRESLEGRSSAQGNGVRFEFQKQISISFLLSSRCFVYESPSAPSTAGERKWDSAWRPSHWSLVCYLLSGQGAPTGDSNLLTLGRA